MLLSAFPLKSHILIGNYVIFTLVHVYGFAARTFHIIVTVLPLSLLPIHNTQLKPPDTPISNIACHSSIFNRVTCMWYENVFRTKTLSFYTGANIFDLLAITNDFDYISIWRICWWLADFRVYENDWNGAQVGLPNSFDTLLLLFCSVVLGILQRGRK